MRTKNQELLVGGHPFSYQVTKDRQVLIFWRGSLKKRLKRNDAQGFMESVGKMSDDEAQFLMARMTGNFKRGSETRNESP